MTEGLIGELVGLVRAEGRALPAAWQVNHRQGTAWFCGAPPHEASGWAFHPLHSQARARLIADLDAALREAGDDRPLAMEVAVHADGSVEFGHSFDFRSATPPTVVIDAGFRCPGHHVMPVPEAARPTGAPTDPRVLDSVEAMVREFADHYRRVKGRAPQFGEPVGEADLAQAEERLGLRLPDDVRALYRAVGDDRFETGLLGRYSLLPLDSLDAGAWRWQTDPFEQEPVFEPDPPRAVRRVSSSDGWVVIGRDAWGDEVAVDLDPGPDGRAGQLITSGRETDGQVLLVAESVSAQLSAVVGALRAGRVDPDGDAEDDTLAVVEDAPACQVTAAFHRLGDLRSAFAERDPRTVQCLYLNDADALDLRELTAAPRLRTLNVNRAGRVDLWLPDTVESLSLNARDADLTRLAGHPALWNLTVSGMPVRVADLPPVVRLDLSGADVADLAAVADLDVRVLTLSLAQWDRLRVLGRAPKRLAAARIAGNVRLPHAITWKTWLGGSNAG